MKPYIVFSASHPNSDQTYLCHQGNQQQSAINSTRTDQVKLIRTLTELVAIAAFPRFMFASRSMLDILLTIGLARDSQVHVLISGETGTGKELIARAIYLLGSRKERKFITVNCA